MRISLVGPYRDSLTGKSPDEDLQRVALSRHKATDGQPTKIIGHGKLSDKSVLIFHYCGLNERERLDAAEWARELLEETE